MAEYAQYVKDKLQEVIQSLQSLRHLYESYNVFAHIERKGLNYLIRVKDKDSNGILGAIRLPETDTFDIDVHKCLTRKQTNEIKAHPEKYHFLPKNSTFGFLNLHTNLFYDMDFIYFQADVHLSFCRAAKKRR